jgi:DNA polymerase III epsilon subunit-like protein
MDDSVLFVLVIVGMLVGIGLIAARIWNRGFTESEEKAHFFESQAQPSVESQAETPKVAPSLPDSQLSKLLPSQFVVLDLETTGLSAERDEIIEIGAIRVVLDSQNHLAFQTLVKPARKIPRKITSMTGITQKMVDEEGVPLEEALIQFKEFIADLPLVTFRAASR